METVAQSADPELHLLTDWEAVPDRGRRRFAGVASIAVHFAATLVILSIPAGFFDPPKELAQVITPLTAPLTEPTQIEPNKRKLNKEFDATEVAPRPQVQIPPSPPSTTRPAAQQPSLPPPVPVQPKPAPQSLPEPPKVEASLREPPKFGADPALAPPPVAPPQIQPQETKPKLAFENPATQMPAAPSGGQGRVAAPNTSLAEAMRSTVRGGGGGLVLGDSGSGIGGIGEGVNLPPSPGRQGSSLELLSDPMGVDFRPYLIKVLAAVRRNWWAVMPETARMGRRGRVGIQFAIARNGNVPKLVIVGYSGTDALDRAAVAGVSASTPFPPLPAEFKGDQIRLQFTFSYNMQQR